MNRLFQQYDGEIKALKGLTLKGLSILIDDETNDEEVILVWIQTENNWLRIFIDGSYCGVDEYETNESSNDMDDDVSFREHNDWVKDLKIKAAGVKSGILPLIVLTISFTNGNQLVLNCDKDHKCTLRLINS